VRVVALSAEPSLAAALNMSDDWEVVYADDPEHAAEVVAGTNVVLIGGGTEEGLRLAESLRSLGVTIPTVVVGDEPAPQGARHPVLTRPFTLDELHMSIERAVMGSQQSAPTIPQREDAPVEQPAPPKQPSAIPERAAPPREVEAAPPPPVRAESQRTSDSLEKPHAPAEQAPIPVPPRRHAEATGRGLLRRRAKGIETPAEDPLTIRLRAANETLGEVEAALDELPMLADLTQLTAALLKEVMDLLWPQTAAIYLPSPDGFRVWASHGFSQVEKTMPVQSHQPLFVDLLVRHE